MFYQSLLFIIPTFFTAFADCQEINPPKKVVVIGGGLAGLTTAYRLQKNGCDVEIYEAKNRTGGRVFTAYLDGHVIELGAQNICDGGDAVCTVALIDELGLEKNKKQFVRSSNYFDGEKVVTSKNAMSELSMTVDDLEESLKKASENAVTMQDVLQAFFKDHEVLYKSYCTLLSAYEGAPVDQLSLYYMETFYHMLLGGLSAAHPGSTEEVTYIDYLDIVGGNSLLPEKLAKNLGFRVHLGTPLQSINKTNEGQYDLQFKNGNSTIADIVVLAIPCSTYQNIEFGDQIIQVDRLKAIQNISYGTNSKILIPVSNKAVRVESYSNERLVAFYNTDAYAINLYYVGYNGDFDASTIDETVQRDFPLLSYGYGITSLTPAVVARDGSFAFYNSPVGHCWLNDPYARGSYSFIGIGQEEVFSAMEEYDGEICKSLFAPINESLYFAGEHTAIDLKLGGTMEAAVESGERISRLITRRLQR